MTTELNHTLEVAVYMVHKGTNVNLQINAHEMLATFPGFCRSVRLKGLNKANLRADLILWSSKEDALAASQAIQSDVRFGDFMASIETILDFHHYLGVDVSSLIELAGGVRPIVEIASYDVVSREQMRPLQQQVHDAVAQLVDAKSFVCGYDGEKRMLDILGWPSIEAHQQAPSIIQSQRPSLAPFFEGVDNMHVFELLEVI